MDLYNSSYEQDPTPVVVGGGSEDELEASRFDVLREIMEELEFGSQKLIKKLVMKLAKKAKEGDNSDVVLEWFDEVARLLRIRSAPEEETVDCTSREASEMELTTKLERFKVKTLDVLADQGKK